MWHMWGRREMPTVFWLGNLKERPRCRGGDNIKMDLKEVNGKVWSGLI
jgi:hypothetical protein